MLRRGRLLGIGLLGFTLLTACATPIGVETADPRGVQRYLTRSVLTDDRASDFSENVLRRYDLHAIFEEQPRVALVNLHGAARAEGFRPDALFALAELSFIDAERTHRQAGYAATMIYAWALLFPETGERELNPLDPRVRIAADLYNRALTLALRRERGGHVHVEAGREVEIGLPFGRVVVSSSPDLLVVDGTEYYDLRPVAELRVRGLRNRYRRAGIGAPLAARARPVAGKPPAVEIAEGGLVPLTAVVFIEAPLAGLASGSLRARTEVFTSLDAEHVEIAGRVHPLESEPTAALASALSESRFWESELSHFLGNAVGLRREAALSSIRPYVGGRIPVVFVHGTASSPARWADMINDMMGDARLRERYAFWTFRYDSGNPIAYSAWQLRHALAQAVDRIDATGLDPCVRDMVVLGHSQGGLLTKLTVVDSGDRFWRNLSRSDFASANLSSSTRTLLEKTLFVEPLPFVTEVLFLATPHRGSYLAGPQIVRRIADRFVRLPSDIVRVGLDLVTLAPTGEVGMTLSRIPTSIDNMSPGNPYIQALSEIPVAEGVRSHSIIAVSDPDDPLESASDGVVKYASAKHAGVDSEQIVVSPHSGMQSAAGTIEGVRQVLLEHSSNSRCPMPARPTAPKLVIAR